MKNPALSQLYSHILWQSPLRRVAGRRKNTPEAWHAEVLHDEQRGLEIAVRSLEFAIGFEAGRNVGRVENVLATRLIDAEPGAAPVAAH